MMEKHDGMMEVIRICNFLCKSSLEISLCNESNFLGEFSVNDNNEQSFRKTVM